MWCCSLHFKGYRAFIWRVSGPRSAVMHMCTACRWLGSGVRQSAHVHCYLQTVGSVRVGTFHTEDEGTILFLKLRSPGVFTQRQTDRHSVIFQGTPNATCWLLWNFRTVKSSLLLPHTCLCAWHVGKWERRGIALVILSFGTWGRWMVSFKPQPL